MVTITLYTKQKKRHRYTEQTSEHSTLIAPYFKIWTPIISSLRVCWPFFPWKGMWLMLENLEPVQDVKWYFLSAPRLSLHWHSLVVGLEALRIIRFGQVLFPWSVFPGSKKMIAETSVSHVVMKYITCAGISYVILLRRSLRSHPSLCCVPPRSSARLPSE